MMSTNLSGRLMMRKSYDGGNPFPHFKDELDAYYIVEASHTLLKETTFGNQFMRIPLREFLEIKFCIGHTCIEIGQTYRKVLHLV
jgi:hypothetical protein